MCVHACILVYVCEREYLLLMVVCSNIISIISVLLLNNLGPTGHCQSKGF